MRNPINLPALVSIAAAAAASLVAQDYRAPSGNVTFRAMPLIVSDAGESHGGSIPMGLPVTLYDFNHDGNLDILWFSPYYGLATLLGDGKGNFNAGVFSPWDQAGCAYSAFTDINGDGIPDFVTCSGIDEFYVGLGNADGTFQEPLVFPTRFTYNPNLALTTNIVAADVNGDGKPDIVVAGEAGCEIWLNTSVDGVPSFAMIAQITPAKSAVNPLIAVADLNGDGKPDLLFSTPYAIGFYPGKGDGTFGSPRVLKLPDPGAAQWEALTLADWNGDGRLGLILSTGTGLPVYLATGNGDGTFQLAGKLNMPPSEPSADFVVADVNGDGIPDISANSADAVVVFYGRGGGKFDLPVIYKSGFTEGALFGSGLFVGSLRNNGRTDLVASVEPGVSPFFNTGHGFEATPEIASPDYAIAFAAGDFTNDGLEDLAVLTNSPTSTSEVAIFAGTGSAAKPFSPGAVIGLAAAAFSIVTGDFNNDGNLDIAVLEAVPNTNDKQVFIVPGEGDGSFGPAIAGPVGILTNLAAGDLNGDGNLDLVANGDNDLVAMYGNGDGTFQGPVNIAALPSFIDVPIRVVDLNHDGRPDILGYVYTESESAAIVVVNLGGGEFAPVESFPDTANGDMITCDVNGDGIPDILSSDDSPYPAVLLGSKNGTYTPVAQPVGPLLSGSELACGTFTGTSRLPEVAVLSGYQGTIDILKNSGGGLFSMIPMVWAAGTGGPVDVIAGKFHGPSLVDDLVILNANGFIAYLENITLP